MIKKLGESPIASPTLLNIQMEPIVIHWSSSKSNTKYIDIINEASETISFALSPGANEPSTRIFHLHPTTATIAPTDRCPIKITVTDLITVGRHREQWVLDIHGSNLKILLLISCEVTEFSIAIDLPLLDAMVDSPMKTFDLDFGSVACGAQSTVRREVRIENPTSVDLRVKIRREAGAIGNFEIPPKYTKCLLLAHQTTTLPVQWSVANVVEEASCTYEIYFRQDFKYQLVCHGRSHFITYRILHQSKALGSNPMRIYLQGSLPDHLVEEEVLIENTGHIDMRITCRVDRSPGEVEAHLSHSQAVVPAKSSMVLKIELRMKRIHRDEDTKIIFDVPHAKQNRVYTLYLRSNVGWPEFSLSELSRLLGQQVDDDCDELKDHLTLCNKGPVTMRIDQLYSTSTSVTLDPSLIFPLEILPRELLNCPFVYKVERKSTDFDCHFVAQGNFQQVPITIPFSCKRLTPVIIFSQTVIHCGTVKSESKTKMYFINIQNRGYVSAAVRFKSKVENDDRETLSLRSTDGLSEWTCAAGQHRTIGLLIEMKKSISASSFKRDLSAEIVYLKTTTKKQKLIVTSRVQNSDSVERSNLGIDFPSSWRFLNKSPTFRQLITLLEDETKPQQQRAAVALSPLIVLFDQWHSDVSRTAHRSNEILSSIESNVHLVTDRSLLTERIMTKFPAEVSSDWKPLVRNVLDRDLFQSINGLEGRTADENMTLATTCALKLAILIEAHSKWIDDQILARLIEYEEQQHIDRQTEHDARRRLLDYTTELLLNQQSARRIDNDQREQTRRFMEKLITTVRTIGTNQTLRESLPAFATRGKQQTSDA